MANGSRKFEVSIVAVGLLGAAAAIALCVLPDREPEKRRQKPKPPAEEMPAPAAGPSRDPEGAQRLLLAASRASTREEKIDCCDRAIASDPTCAQAFARRAGLHAEAGSHEQAWLDYGEAVRLSGGNAEWRLARAEAAAKSGRAAEGIEELTKAMEGREPDRRMLTTRAILRLHAGDGAAAIKDFDTARALDAGVRAEDAYGALAHAMYGSPDRALKEVDRVAAALMPPPEAAWLARIVAHARRARGPSDVRASARELSFALVGDVMLKKRDAFPPALKVLAETREAALDRQGMTPALVLELCARASELAVRQPPGCGPDEVAEAAAERLVQPAHLHRVFEAAMACDPSDPTPFVKRGLLFLELKSAADPQVERDLRAAEKLARERPEVRGLRGAWLLRSASGNPDRIAEALADLQCCADHAVVREDAGRARKRLDDDVAKPLRAAVAESLGAVAAREKCGDCASALAKRAATLRGR